MIALVRGELVLRRPDHVVIDSGGVGYRLAVSAQTLKDVPAVGSEATLHAHLIVRDDALALYGFSSEQERDLFLLLIGVQSVGPKVALAVLSGGSARALLGAIAAGDAGRFQAVPGIGKRTAERIIVELRDKVAADPPGGAIAAARGGDGEETDPLLLARDGLTGLGFGPQEIDGLLADANGDSAEELIAAALRSART